MRDQQTGLGKGKFLVFRMFGWNFRNLKSYLELSGIIFKHEHIETCKCSKVYFFVRVYNDLYIYIYQYLSKPPIKFSLPSPKQCSNWRVETMKSMPSIGSGAAGARALPGTCHVPKDAHG